VTTFILNPPGLVLTPHSTKSTVVDTHILDPERRFEDRRGSRPGSALFLLNHSLACETPVRTLARPFAGILESHLMPEKFTRFPGSSRKRRLHRLFQLALVYSMIFSAGCSPQQLLQPLMGLVSGVTSQSTTPRAATTTGTPSANPLAGLLSSGGSLLNGLSGARTTPTVQAATATTALPSLTTAPK